MGKVGREVVELGSKERKTLPYSAVGRDVRLGTCLRVVADDLDRTISIGHRIAVDGCIADRQGICVQPVRIGGPFSATLESQEVCKSRAGVQKGACQG